MLGFKSFMAEAKESDIYTRVAAALNAISIQKNFRVSNTSPKGKPGKNDKTMREFRMQLINKNNDTALDYIQYLKVQLQKSNIASNVVFNPISPNSSKFPSYTFEVEGKKIDVVIARGANKGENFETQTVVHLGKYFLGSSDKNFAKLIDQMNEAHPPFASVEIASVKQRKGSTKKTGVRLEDLGEVIGDIVLTDTTNKKWYISLKDVNGATVSAWPGAGSIFNNSGELQPTSEGSKFLSTFGLDLNKVQAGFDERNKKTELRKKLPIIRANQNEIKSIFERVWGMNYFYVRRQSSGWKVFWLDRAKLNELTDNIQITRIDYPSTKSKSVRIHCKNNKQQYLIEIRNSKAGEYPNDIKFRVVP